MRDMFSRLLLIAAVAAGLAGCSTGPIVRVDADPAVDVSAYRSFGFLEPLSTDQAGYSTLLSARLREAARRELEAKGYAYQAADPDLLVNFNVNVVDRTEVRSSPRIGIGYGYYSYRSGMYVAWSGYPYDVESTTYRQGTLTIDVVDARRKALVWQGQSEGRVTRQMTEDPAGAVDTAVRQIFERFPGRPAAAL